MGTLMLGHSCQVNSYFVSFQTQNYLTLVIFGSKSGQLWYKKTEHSTCNLLTIFQLKKNKHFGFFLNFHENLFLAHGPLLELEAYGPMCNIFLLLQKSPKPRLGPWDYMHYFIYTNNKYSEVKNIYLPNILKPSNSQYVIW